MSRYHLQPSVDTWQTELTPFRASIIAYDEENKRISRKQLYIIYDITTDNSTPDLINNGKELFANKDGVIELYFDRACRVSIDLYMVEHFDEFLDLNTMADPSKYICKHICDDLAIPFAPYITKFIANYTDNIPVPVNDYVPRKYIQVTLEKSDNTTEQFTIEKEDYNNYIVTPDKITHTELNTCVVSYYDNILFKTWEADIYVPGKYQELSMFAIYNGETRELNSLIPKTDVTVYIIVFDGTQQSQVQLVNTEWEFTTFPQVTNLNLGHFIIAHDDLKCELFVPFVWVNFKYRLDAWYEGEPVLVGDRFVPDNFRIYLYNDKGLRQLIPFDQCNIDPNDYIIHKTGINWFTITFRVDAFTLKDKVAIIGYKEPNYVKGEFSMLYLDPNIKTFIDLTEFFNECCMVGSSRYFTWSKILSRIIELDRFGIYRLYAPVRTGLSNRCDTEWLINCFNDKAITAEIIVTHWEEEEPTNGGNESEENNNEDNE